MSTQTIVKVAGAGMLVIGAALILLNRKHPKYNTEVQLLNSHAGNNG